MGICPAALISVNQELTHAADDKAMWSCRSKSCSDALTSATEHLYGRTGDGNT
jgi:hypothetical protein